MSVDTRSGDIVDSTAARPVASGVIAMLALLAAVAPLSIDMYLPAFPRMAEEFGVSATAIQLTLTTFLVGLAIGNLVIGPLSDRFGRRPLLLVGTFVSIIATILCAWSPTVEWLTVFRFLQGFTGAAGVVLSRAVISDRARGAAAAKLFSLLVLVNGVAPVIAPLLGGAVIGLTGWRGVFWVLAGVSVLMFVGVLALLPESHPAELRSTGGLSAMIADAREVLSNKRFLGYAGAFAFGFGVMFAYISASPFVLQEVHGLSTTWYSIAFTANALGIVVTSGANAKLVDRVRPEALLRIGLVSMVAFSALLVVDAVVGPYLWATLVLLWFAVASLGLVIANATTLALGEARRAAGTGSAVMGAAQFGLAAVISPLVGLGGEGTAVPMAVTMLVSAIIGLGGVVLGTRSAAEQSVTEAH
ncbi:multidrug effflux MFS transporter [Rhodococcus sp. BP-349]|uniref:multidrug effflux MFS transporter n=1 Tax=unclassified Rhodococcus (in: high G+C Gram-positive bacteria) TaxID=192944 RepID=UPI001C9A5FD7|nr:MULTISPECIES: multidrug effflux MFS transporter [unclassified Rhodococcus (in: high G+C Gram-positive bacteria)]MBY6537120.1 multidrug effflux MFS transporter [Rhodococcus sp. BP-363]MBY6541457.1 multidrug effflux MFS transporter [Rhodococcus sp. BP-369]MBY6560687.1 multidrug effflux MFS transporter [Rhodococcus sp. BP-370]MBY6574979.1 multidrug effflux MFS transporter [Rhodococcus sp. BP-364]MBY6584280.1 multidrug effflux MFS transporter [Rhodococcus sp. BP-358]